VQVELDGLAPPLLLGIAKFFYLFLFICPIRALLRVYLFFDATCQEDPLQDFFFFGEAGRGDTPFLNLPSP